MYYHNCRLIAGTGAPTLEDAVLITEGTKIVYAGTAADAPARPAELDEQLDLGGRTLLPGLFNCHVHLGLRFPFTSERTDEYGTPAYRAMVLYRRAVEALFCGVTTIRCVGEADYADVAVRDAVNAGMFMGPRILSAGPLIIAKGGHGCEDWGTVECSGPEDFARETRTALAHRVDLIKICLTGGMAGELSDANTLQMTEAEIAAVVGAARKEGRPVAGHIGNDEAVRLALRCGVTSIEHAYVMGKETARMLADSPAVYVPTLAVSASLDYLEKHGNPRYHIEKIRAIGRRHRQSAANAVEAGATIAVGTDLLPSDPLDGTNATVREVELLCEAGLSPLEAIRAATKNAAKLCGVEAVTGTLQEGKEADLIAVSGCPDREIKALRNIDMVIRGGAPVRSGVKGDSRPQFAPLPFGKVPEGASFISW